MAQYIKTEEGYKKLATFRNDKMDKFDPVGIGSFSMNRKAGTVVGVNSHAEGIDTTASGQFSHAEGSWTIASGEDSHAEGNSTTASGSYSHAEGNGTVASGEASHAEGYWTTTSGYYSHAEGGSTNDFSSVVTTTNPTTEDIINVWKNKKFSVAKGDYSHVEGKDNLALDDYSHAEGDSTTASGTNSHAEGQSTKASGFSSHAEGNNTKATSTNDSTSITFSPDKGYYTHAEGFGTVAYGRCSHAEGNGTKASGSDSHSEGYGTVAYGTCSHAEGDETIASGTSSHAEGYKTTASGFSSHAEGYSTNMFSSVVTTTNPTTDSIITAWKSKKFSVAKGNYSHVEGKDNLALGEDSHAEGENTIASVRNSHAEGENTIASGRNSHAEGYKTTASGEDSHAEGNGTTAREKYSHTEGNNTTASGQSSHAEGDHTTASGFSSHAEGYNITASGDYSHAEGYKTTASGDYSHAEGYYTTASKSYSHAEGSTTIASGDYSHVQGKYNIEDTSNTYADIIGNGASNTARSNAATVDWEGNAWFAGDVYTGSTSGTNKDDGSKKLATEEYVDSSIATNSVLYTAQSPTEEQKVQARQNIGAQDLYNGLTPVSYSCTDGTYSVSDTVYLESGNIISPTDIVSNDVRIAFRFINSWYIANQLDYWKNDIKKYKLLIDNGYLENNTIWYSKPDKKFKKQIRVGTNSTLGNYIIFNFNYDYEVIGQIVYYVDTDTISTGTDTYVNRKLTRDKNNVLSYSAIKLSSDPTEPMQIATKQYVDNSIAASSADISLGLTSAAVGQTIKVKAVDESGKPTEWEAVDIPSAVTDDHINSLIDAKLGVIENGSY